MDAREPSDELYALARKNWLYNDTFDMAHPELRDRAIRDAGLEDVFDLAFDIVANPLQREDYLIAMIDTRRDDHADLKMLGAGWVETVWHDGDHEILEKLRHRGVPSAIVAAIDASVYR